jgi:hypothetical protein
VPGTRRSAAPSLRFGIPGSVTLWQGTAGPEWSGAARPEQIRGWDSKLRQAHCTSSRPSQSQGMSVAACEAGGRRLDGEGWNRKE